MNQSNHCLSGLSGLTNLGNTCYINTCMQVLSHTTALNSLLDNSTLEEPCSELTDTQRLQLTPIRKRTEEAKNEKYLDNILLREWNNLRKLLWKQNCTVSPNRWIHTIQHISKQKDLELFSGYLQNDVTEFLLFILNSFHNALSKEVEMTIHGKANNNIDVLAKHCLTAYSKFFKSNYSDIIKLFYGIEINIIRDLNDKTLSQSYNPFSIITLPLLPKSNLNIIELFNHYHKEEELDNDNLWENEKKEKIKIKKLIKVWNFPDILIIFFKRWNYVNNKKDQRLIDFPLNNLNLSKHVIGYIPHTFVYDLYGVCNHSGSNDGGHYTAFIKHNINNKWYHFNDTNITEIHPTNIVTNQAYCLFYNKKNIQ
jgi:ubiquitin C-terminal hydrolase